MNFRTSAARGSSFVGLLSGVSSSARAVGCAKPTISVIANSPTAYRLICLDMRGFSVAHFLRPTFLLKRHGLDRRKVVGQSRRTRHVGQVLDQIFHQSYQG